MPTIIDLRGRQAPPTSSPVLADPTGKRSRVMAAVGRVVALLFLLWFLALSLAGLGILPTSAIPFARRLGPQTPPKLKAYPRPAQPSPSDLAAAKPRASSLAGATAAARRTPRAARGGHSAGIPSRTNHRGKAVPHRPAKHNGPTHGGGHPGGTSKPTGGGTTTSPGASSGAGTGQGKSTSRPGAGSGAGNGRGRTTTTPPGRSGSAPGHTRTSSASHSHPY